MAITKYATFEQAEVLDVKGAPTQQHFASLDKLADFDNYRTGDGYLYVRIRAISSRVNKNHDGWPSVELAGSPEIFERHHSGSGFTLEAAEGNPEYGFATFIGKPIFVDHHNSNPKKARGVIVDAKLRVLDHRTAGFHDRYWASHDVDPEHMPPTEVELLLEVDANSFPRLARAIISGDLDGFSMGCFVAGTPITLDDGTQKPIEKMTVGDKVLTHTGQVEKVTATMTRQYKGDIYRVKTYGQAQTMTLTSEHPVWVAHSGSAEREWVEAKDLRVDDYVLTPRVRPNVIAGDNGNHAWARLIGFYLAEGNLGYDKKRYPDGRPVFVEWHFHVDELDYINAVKRDLSICGYQACGPYIKNNCATIRCNSPELASSFLATAGQHSWGKKLAPAVLGWSQADQKELLASYFAGDGHMRPHTIGKVEIGTASKDLAHQIFTLATRVGYRMTPPVKQHSPSAAKKRPKYSMHVDTRGNEPAGNWKGFLDPEGLWRKITKVTSEHFEGPVYNFDVQGPDSYVAADIAVHNCDVDASKCSHCGHMATSPDEFCSHILMKGAHHDFKTADGKRVSRKSYENCYGIRFFEISAVFDPADETALAREVRSAVQKEADIVPSDLPGDVRDPIPGRTPEDEFNIEREALEIQNRFGVDGQGQPMISLEKATELANEKHLQDNPLPGGSNGAVWHPKQKDYMDANPDGMPVSAPGQEGFPPPRRLQTPDTPFAQNAQAALDEAYPKRPVMNDPRWSYTKTAENPLPQSMMTRAPDELDTLRDEQVCPICGNDMDSETCTVCGFVSPPKEFDNPDLDKAMEIRQQMKQQEEQQATQPQVPGGQLGEPNPNGPAQPGQAPGQMPTKVPPTANVKSEMHWTPKVHPKTAARINQVENPVSPAINKPVSDEPQSVVVTKDQTRPVTSAMRTAQQLMTNAQRNHGESMNTRTADGPTPPGDTSPKQRVDVTGVGGVDEASNEEASKTNDQRGHNDHDNYAQVDLLGVGTTGTSDVSADKTESLPTAGRESDDAGFNTDKNIEAIPTKTYPDKDGEHPGVTDPVTRETLEQQDQQGGSKGPVSHVRHGYDDKTLEQNEQQGDPVAQGGSAVQGVQPIDPVATDSYKRVNVLEHQTTPEASSSGPTTTWTGTDGNGVLKQQPPVTNEIPQTGGVPTPDVQLHTTGRVSIAALRLAEAEVDLGLISREDKWNRIAEADSLDPAVVKAQLDALARVKTAGLNKLAQQRQASLTRLPRAFGKSTSAPNGFERIASDVPKERHAISNDVLDAGLFMK